jgi:hypothetical protein
MFIYPSTIKVPVDLPPALVGKRRLVNEYETNLEIKAVGAWLLLKSLTTSGLIQRYTNQLPGLLEYTRLSRASFYRTINRLDALGLAGFDGRNLWLASWKKLEDLYGITTTSFIEVNYSTNDKKAIHWIIPTLEIEHNKDRQRNALMYKLDKNPDLKTYLESILIKAGAPPEKLLDYNYMIEQLWKLQLLSFQDEVGSDIYETLDLLRFDVNRAAKGFKKSYHFKSDQSASYWRKKMKDAGLIDVERLAVISDHWARKNKITWVRWLKTSKQTIWFACNQISTTPGLIATALDKQLQNAA